MDNNWLEGIEEPDIIYVNPRDVKLINGADPKNYEFYRFLLSEAKTKTQLKKSGYFKYYKNQLKAGVHPLRMNNIRTDDDIITRLKYLLECSNKLKDNPNFDNFEMIEVYIDQTGKIRVFEGCHRLIISLYHGFTKIPAKVIHRHPQWEEMKELILSEYAGGELIYNPIEHPDFRKYPIIRQNRSGAIMDFLSSINIYENKDTSSETPEYTYRWNPVHYFQRNHAERLRGLDIGCHFGYYSRFFEYSGAEMTGVEANYQYWQKAQYFNRVFGTSVNYINQSIFECSVIKDKFDFVIGLSIFYHLFSMSENKTLDLLKQISKNSKYLIIDSFPDRLSDEKLQNILVETGFTNITKIYSGKDGRNLYACKSSESRS